MTATLPAGTPTSIVTGRTGPGHIVIDATSVYWTEPSAGNVMKVARGGGTPVTLASGLSNPTGIVVDDTYVWWTNDTPSGSIMRVVKD